MYRIMYTSCMHWMVNNNVYITVNSVWSGGEGQFSGFRFGNVNHHQNKKTLRFSLPGRWKCDKFGLYRTCCWRKNNENLKLSSQERRSESEIEWEYYWPYIHVMCVCVSIPAYWFPFFCICGYWCFSIQHNYFLILFSVQSHSLKNSLFSSLLIIALVVRCSN